MKKFLSLLLIACITATLFGQTIVSTTPSNKNVILEEFTGTNCQYCPDGHKVAAQIMANNPGRAWAINIHQGGYSGNSPQYKTDWGNALANQYGVNSYPAATVNRGSSWSSSRTQWTSWANQILSESSPVNVAATGTINYATRHLSLLVEVYYTGNAAQTTNKLNVALLQNEIIGPQSGMALYPEMIVGSQYRHMHMLRDFLTGQWGMDVAPTTTGSFWSHTFEYDIPEYVTYSGSPITNVPIILEDLEFIVYIAENQKTILSGAKANITYTDLPSIAGKVVAVTEIPVINCSSDAGAYVKLRNTGQNPVTSVEINYTVAGGTPTSLVWNNRTIASMATDTVHLPIFQIQINQSQTVKAELVKINDVAITPSSKSVNIKKEVVQGADSEMKLVIKTDQYGTECSFKIYREDGTVLTQGGPFTNAVVEREFDFLPNVKGCYRLEVKDTYGDGMPGGYIKILNSSGTQIYYAAGNSYTSLLRAMIPYYTTYKITASAGDNGAISPTGVKEYVEGTSATYTFTPNPGYKVDQVKVNDAPVVFENNKYTFESVDKDYTIHVTFKAAPKYKITATVEGFGTISPEGVTEYVEGESAPYTFTPEADYWVGEVYIDDVAMGLENAPGYTFPAVDKDYKIHVFFAHFDGIKDINGVRIAVAPNPMNDKLFIKGIYDKLEMFSVSGQLLMNVFNKPTIDVAHLSKGIYFVKIHANGQVCTFKVVK